MSIPDIDSLSIFHADKSTFFYIAKRQIIYIRYIYRLNTIFHSPWRQYILNINQRHYSYIFIYYLNSTQNLIFTSINSLHIKSEQLLLIFHFSKCSLYQRKTFIISPQSHKNIIWNHNFISNHIFLSTFFRKINSIYLIFYLFDKFLDSKKI